MDALLVIGDEALCCGFRLAGIATRAMPQDDAAFGQALASAGLLALTPACAARLPPARLHEALALEHPQVVVLPGDGASALERRMRAILGIEA